MRKEYQRKLFHMILGILLGLFVLYFRKRYIIAGLTGILCAGLLVRLFLLKGYKLEVIEKILVKFGRPKEVGMGAMYFLIGSLIALLFPFPRDYIAVSLFVLGVSDGLSTIMGIGSKHKVYESKSFEGSSAFLVSSFIIIFFKTSLFQAVLVSIILTIIELFSPVDDNIIIPPVCSLLLSLTTW